MRLKPEKWSQVETGRANFDLKLSLQNTPQGLTGTFELQRRTVRRLDNQTYDRALPELAGEHSGRTRQASGRLTHVDRSCSTQLNRFCEGTFCSGPDAAQLTHRDDQFEV